MCLDLIPEDCFSHILSFTSPIDACRVSLVCSMVRSAADSDSVWEKFLPSDYQQILSRLVHPLVYSSKKDLFLRLCNPHLIDGSTKSFSLDKSTSKKRFILGARDLKITWAKNPLYWSWTSLHQSRFPEVAELRTIWWLEIQGKIFTKMLSPKTVYRAYLIVKFANRAYGLDILPSEVSIQVGNTIKSQGLVYLRCEETKKRLCVEPMCRFFRSLEVVPSEREDGWREIELGKFYNDGGANQEVKMCLKEVKGAHLKGGLIVEGIELRPKD